MYFYFSKKLQALSTNCLNIVQFPSWPPVSVLVSKQESEVRRKFSCCSTIAWVSARRELTVPILVIHLVSDFTECIRYTDQVSRFIPRHKIKHPSIVVYLTTVHGVFGLSVYFFLVSSTITTILIYHNYLFLTRSSKRPKEYLSS